ncbi:MAG: XRE family transcriptional regulator [Firmicutes bacterium]|nr:XRE family transcriptional regulator [Bacillota bacterium]
MSKQSTTLKLSKVLKSDQNIVEILKENETEINSPTLKDYLSELLKHKNLQRKTVIRKAQLDINYANQLFNGRRTNPGRNQVLALAFAFSLNKEETDRLLRIAGKGALHPKNRRDAVIIHALENEKGVDGVNSILDSLKYDVL